MSFISSVKKYISNPLNAYHLSCILSKDAILDSYNLLPEKMKKDTTTFNEIVNTIFDEKNIIKYDTEFKALHNIRFDEIENSEYRNDCILHRKFINKLGIINELNNYINKYVPKFENLDKFIDNIYDDELLKNISLYRDYFIRNKFHYCRLDSKILNELNNITFKMKNNYYLASDEKEKDKDEHLNFTLYLDNEKNIKKFDDIINLSDKYLKSCLFGIMLLGYRDGICSDCHNKTSICNLLTIILAKLRLINYSEFCNCGNGCCHHFKDFDNEILSYIFYDNVEL